MPQSHIAVNIEVELLGHIPNTRIIDVLNAHPLVQDAIEHGFPDFVTNAANDFDMVQCRIGQSLEDLAHACSLLDSLPTHTPSTNFEFSMIPPGTLIRYQGEDYIITQYDETYVGGTIYYHKDGDPYQIYSLSLPETDEFVKNATVVNFDLPTYLRIYTEQRINVAIDGAMGILELDPSRSEVMEFALEVFTGAPSENLKLTRETLTNLAINAVNEALASGPLPPGGIMQVATDACSRYRPQTGFFDEPN